MSYSCFRNPTSVIEMKPEQCPKSADLQGWLYWSSTPTRWWSTGWKPGHLLTHWPITSRFLTIFKALCWVLICRRFKSHGAGCASQDPKASVGGLFAILSDLGPSKGKQACESSQNEFISCQIYFAVNSRMTSPGIFKILRSWEQ